MYVRIGRELTQADAIQSPRLVFNPENSHVYEYKHNNTSFHEAKSLAAASSLGDYSAHILTIDNDLEAKFFTTRWDGGPAFEDTIGDYVGTSWLGIEFSNGQWTYTETDSSGQEPIYFNWRADEPRSDHGGHL